MIIVKRQRRRGRERDAEIDRRFRDCYVRAVAEGDEAKAARIRNAAECTGLRLDD